MILLALLVLVMAYQEPMPTHAGAIHTHTERNAEIHELIHQAGHSVDHAWEAFHKAALGGTLASPELQMNIEASLGEARRLLVEARDAAEEGNESMVKCLVSKIKLFSDRVIEESQRRKQ